MKYSVIIASRSEGYLLHATIQDVLKADPNGDTEIIVVDDGSDDYSGEDVASAFAESDRVRIIRNDMPLGCSVARNMGAREARAEILVFLDAHTSVPEGWLGVIDESVSAHIANPYERTAYTTALGQLYIDSEPPDVETFNFQARFENAELMQTIDGVGRHTTRPYPLQLMEGAVMLFGKEWFDHIGGFDEGLIPPWGQECHEISFRTWLLGGECRIIPTLLVRTLYRTEFTYGGVHHENITFNKLRLAYCLFSDARFERVVEAMIGRDAVYREFTAKALRMLMNSDSAARRAELRDRFVRTDDEIAERFSNIRW